MAASDRDRDREMKPEKGEDGERVKWYVEILNTFHEVDFPMRYRVWMSLCTCRTTVLTLELTQYNLRVLTRVLTRARVLPSEYIVAGSSPSLNPDSGRRQLCFLTAARSPSYRTSPSCSTACPGSNRLAHTTYPSYPRTSPRQGIQ